MIAIDSLLFTAYVPEVKKTWSDIQHRCHFPCRSLKIGKPLLLLVGFVHVSFERVEFLLKTDRGYPKDVGVTGARHAEGL